MQIDIRVRGQAPAQTLSGVIVAAIHGHLGRFGSEVLSVHVRVTDVNGPRRGIDMHVAVSVQGPRIGAITVEDMHEAPTLAVAGALERVEQAVQRDVDRLRAMRRSRRPIELRPMSAHP